MPEKLTRRFTLTDMMIIVATAAAGLLVNNQRGDVGPAVRSRGGLVWLPALQLAPFLLVVPLGLLAARSLAPRPRRWRAFRQPGTAACLTALAYPLWDEYFLQILIAIRFWNWHSSIRIFANPDPELGRLLSGFVHFSGLFIAYHWVFLALIRAWNPATDWVDRAGRAYGILMIAIWLMVELRI
jgi:hypothetical protein